MCWIVPFSQWNCSDKAELGLVFMVCFGHPACPFLQIGGAAAGGAGAGPPRGAHVARRVEAGGWSRGDGRGGGVGPKCSKPGAAS